MKLKGIIDGKEVVVEVELSEIISAYKTEKREFVWEDICEYCFNNNIDIDSISEDTKEIMVDIVEDRLDNSDIINSQREDIISTVVNKLL